MRSELGWALIAALAATSGGCVAISDYNRLQKDQQALQETLGRCRQEKDDLRDVVIDQQKQIRSLRALGPKRLEKLFYVSRIELGRYTGGVDLDGDGRSYEGIKVYLRPMDQHGSVIKAAGDVKIQLYDLAADPKANLIGEYDWNVDQLAKQWSGGFITYHYSFVCRWKSGPPKHDKVTVRVKFTDYLTGSAFSAEKQCAVKPPPGAGAD